MTFHTDPDLAPELDVDRTATGSDCLFCRWVDDLALLYAQRQKLHRLSRLDGQLAFAIQTTPVEHHVRVKTMRTSHSCNARARFQGLLHNQPLLSSGTTLPDLPDQHTPGASINSSSGQHRLKARGEDHLSSTHKSRAE